MEPANPAPPLPDLQAKHLEILNEIARIATLDLELRPMMQRITDVVAEKFDWPFVALVMVDRERNVFVCEAVTSALPSAVRAGYSRPLGSGVVGEVAASEQPLILDDVSEYANYVETMPGAAAEICVPVKHGGKLVAILNLESTQRGAFHDQLPLLMTVAEQIAGAIANARLYEGLKRRARLMEMMSDVSRTALEATDLDELLDRVVRYVHDRFPVEIVAILIHDPDRREFVQRAHAGDVFLSRGSRFPLSAGIVGRCIRTGKMQLVPDVGDDPEYLLVNPRVVADLVVPICFQDEILGVFDLESTTAEVFSPENVLAFEAFADQIAGAIRVFRLNQQLDEQRRALQEANAHLTSMTETLGRLSVTDALTETANRRHFDSMLTQEWRRLARSGAPLSLLMIDIDFFKPYNDTYGHQSGDDCLRRVAEALRGMLQRASDCLARYGGEEFAVLLPDMDSGKAHHVAEELRERVASLQIEHRTSASGPNVTISIGLATVVPKIESSPDALLREADDALYEAKHSGRNRVVAH